MALSCTLLNLIKLYSLPAALCVLLLLLPLLLVVYCLLVMPGLLPQ
jgi:hypothetical protein